MITIANQRKREDWWNNNGCPGVAEVIYMVLNVARLKKIKKFLFHNLAIANQQRRLEYYNKRSISIGDAKTSIATFINLTIFGKIR